MTKFIVAASVAGLLAAGAVGAQAQERDRDRDRDRARMHEVCTTVTKCHREDGRRICHKERECKMVPDRH